MEKMGVILMQKYELGRLLGQGTFAKVYHARRLSTNQSVAIKIISKDKISSKLKLIDQIKREISVMRRVKHPNIVELYEVMASRTKIYFVMEYVRGGELFDKVSKGRLGEDEARRYFQQMIGAVDFCHSRGVYHRDIKPENLLLGEQNGDLKITDFGLSTLRRQDGLLIQTTCGTPAYVAPEVINNLKGYDGSKADIWSCGVVLYVLLAGFLPFHDENLMDMYRKISRGDFKCPQWFPAEVRKLLYKLLDPNPKTRLTVAELMKNPWVVNGFVIKRPMNLNLKVRCCRMMMREDDQKVSSPTTPQDVRDAFSMYLEESSSSISSSSSRSSCANLDKIGEEEEDGNEIHETPSSNCMEKMKLTQMNAFDIISMSRGFDLSGLFEHTEESSSSSSPSHSSMSSGTPRGEAAARFATDKSASAIVSRLEELAETERFAVRKKGGKVTLQSSKEGRKGLLAIEAEIFEIAPCLHMVEVSKASGDTWEYNKFCESDLRPALKDITWTWEGSNGVAVHHDEKPAAQADTS